MFFPLHILPAANQEIRIAVILPTSGAYGTGGHQIIRSSDHQIIRSSDHQTLRPSDHQTIRSSDCIMDHSKSEHPKIRESENLLS